MMRLHHFFLLTHGSAALAVAFMFAAAIRGGSTEFMIVSASLSLVTLGAASWYASVRICNGLSNLESVVADQDACEDLSTGLIEIDQAADRIAVDAARWESVAANNREQARDFQSMMFLLKRRGPDRPATSGELRGLLAGLGNTLHGRLTEVESAAVDIERNGQSIIVGAESQSDTVIMTTAHLEQLCAAIELVLANALEIESANDCSSFLATEAQKAISEISVGFKRIRTDSQSCEKKLRGLCDPVQQINAIVETISNVAERTDLLALNASIEAVRAGENGRQFSKVADEVRKLAEQSTHATREITSLLDSMQLVTQESIHRIARGREYVETHVDNVTAAENSLSQICQTSDDGANRVRQVKESSTQQLQLAQNIVNAMEKISEVAKASRSDAENTVWLGRSLSKVPAGFAHTVERLRQCDGAVIQDDAEHDTVQHDAVQRDAVQRDAVQRDAAERDEQVVPAAPVASPLLTSTFVTAE